MKPPAVPKNNSSSTKAGMSAPGKCFAFALAPCWQKQPKAPFWPSGPTEDLVTAEREVIFFPVFRIFTPFTLLSDPTAGKWQAPLRGCRPFGRDGPRQGKPLLPSLLPGCSDGCGQAFRLNWLHYYCLNTGWHVYYLAHFKLHWAESE